MRRSDAELIAIARKAYEAFRTLPNVHAVGVGGRERAGKPTGEIVLKVFVRNKLPLDAISTSGRVPATFEDVPTDVVQCGEPSDDVVDGARLLTSSQFYDHVDERRIRPLEGGTRLEGALRNGFGTLGCMLEVVGNSNIVLAVTCYHVLFDSVAGQVASMKVGQPTPDESCTKCCDDIVGKFLVGERADDSIDAALVQLDPGMQWKSTIVEAGPVAGKHDLTVAEAATLLYQIRKRGATTKLTGGTLQSIGTAGTSSGRHYIDAIVVKPNPIAADPAAQVVFGYHGDSGAAYINDAGEVVGFHFRSDKDSTSAQYGFGFGFPVAELLAKFSASMGVTLRVAADNPVVVHTVPGARAPAPDAQPAGAGRVLHQDLDRTPSGRALLELWLRHSREVNALVQQQARVANVWHRQHGPELLRLLALAPYHPTRPLPVELGGQPVADALTEFLAQVDRFASDGLRRDLAQHREFLLTLPGRSYEEILAQLADEARALSLRN